MAHSNLSSGTAHSRVAESVMTSTICQVVSAINHASQLRGWCLSFGHNGTHVN